LINQNKGLVFYHFKDKILFFYLSFISVFCFIILEKQKTRKDKKIEGIQKKEVKES